MQLETSALYITILHLRKYDGTDPRETKYPNKSTNQLGNVNEKIKVVTNSIVGREKGGVSLHGSKTYIPGNPGRIIVFFFG